MANSVDLGSVVAKLELDIAGFKESIGQVKDQIGQTASHTQKSATVMGSALDNVAKVGMAGLAVATAAAMALVVTNIGAAVKRVDTLDNSARTFENMGIKSTDAKDAIAKLTTSIQGLPTPLDSAIRGMTDLTATYGDVDTGRKVFTALNNAILGFGGTADSVRNAVTQLSQLPMDGPLDGQTWLSLRNSGLTPVLVAMAKDMGIGIGEMREKFMSGQLTVRDFTNKLIEMDEKGGGGMKSLAQIAKDSTKGIGTSIENMKTAVTRGIASILRAIGTEDIAKAITAIGTAFENALKESSGFIQFIKDNKDFISPIIVGITGFVAVITVLYTWFKWIKPAIIGFNAVLSANPVVLITASIIALIAGLAYFFTQTETGRKIWEKLTGAFSKFWEVIKPIREFIVNQLNSAFESLGRIWKQLVDSFRPLIDQFKEFWSKHGDKVVTVLKYVGAAVALIVLAPLIQSFVVFLGALKLLSAALQFVADHFEGIKQIVVTVLKVVFAPLYIAFKIATGILHAFGKDWGDVWNALKDATAKSWAFIKDVFDKLSDAWNRLKTVVESAKNDINGAVDAIKKKWNDFKEDVQSVIDKFIEFKNKVKETFENVKSTVTDSVKTVREKIQQGMDKTKEWIELFKNGFDGDVGTDKLVGRLNGLKDKLNQYTSDTVKGWKEGFDRMKESASQFGSNIGTSLSTAWTSLKTSASTALDSVVSFFTGLPNRISTAFSTAWETVKTTFSNVWTNISTGFSNAGESVVTFFTNLPSKIGEKFTATYEAIKTFFTDLPGKLFGSQDQAGQQSATNVTDGVKKNLSSIETIRKVGDAIVGLIFAAIAAAVVYVVDAAFRLGKQIIQGLANGIGAAAGLVWNAIKGAGDQIGKFFSGAGNWLYDTGTAIVQGLINGIKSMVGAVSGAAGDVGNAVKSKLKSVLGIGSPSKITAQYGVWVGEGFNNGLEGMQRAIGKTLSETFALAPSAVKDLSGTFNAGLTVPTASQMTNGKQVNQTNSSNLTINGNINISNQADADYLLSRLSRRQDLTVQGLVGA